MDYYVEGAGGRPFEALISIEGGNITLHSWSGRPRNSPKDSRGRNPDYSLAFNAIFDRINISSTAVQRVLLISKPVINDPVNDRTLGTRKDFNDLPLQQIKTLIKHRMRSYGRSSTMPANEGNQSKKILIETSLTEDELTRRLILVPTTGPNSAPSPPARPATDTERLPAAELNRVKPVHVMNALRRIDDGDKAANFADSRDYNAVRDDGRVYAPKQVFGLALEEALGIEAKPGHFSAGWGTLCFKKLEESGLWIVSKDGSDRRPSSNATEVSNAIASLTATDEERTWIEGNPRIAVHLKRERQPGLAAKKRAQFVTDHGKLTCESCGLDPSAAYGEGAGAACIEVHHHRTHVADMEPGHTTNLADLRCLCANCHRVLHRALALGLPFEIYDAATPVASVALATGNFAAG